jgi:riboflavin synthase alpha subunit
VFTGIVRERGRIVRAVGGPEGLSLELEAPATAALSGVGDSVSISGACLTVTSVEDGRLRFHAVPETLERSSLGRLEAGTEVNLEPALRAGDPLGGHYVQGHVDGVGAVRSLEPEGEGARLWVDAPAGVLRYCVDKGSIAVEGVSLTIAGLDAAGFAIALVPHTLEATTLGALRPGDPVNLEVDVLAKYVEKLVRADDRGTISRG